MFACMRINHRGESSCWCLSRATDDHWTVSKPYARETPAKTRVLIRQDHDAVGTSGAGGGAAASGGGAAIGSDSPDGRMISSDRPPAARARSPAAGEPYQSEDGVRVLARSLCDDA